MNPLKALGIACALSISSLSYADYTEELKKMLEEKPSAARWIEHQRWDAAKIAAKEKFNGVCKELKLKDCKFIEFKQDFGKTLEKHGKQKEAVLAFKQLKDLGDLEKYQKTVAQELSIIDDLETIAYDYNQLINKHKSDWKNKVGEPNKTLWGDMLTLMAIFQKEFTPYKKKLIEVNTKLINGLKELKAKEATTKK
jgi:hypothetical protein